MVPLPISVSQLGVSSEEYRILPSQQGKCDFAVYLMDKKIPVSARTPGDFILSILTCLRGQS